MSDADCTPGREPRSIAASYYYHYAIVYESTVHIIAIMNCIKMWMYFVKHNTVHMLNATGVTD